MSRWLPVLALPALLVLSPHAFAAPDCPTVVWSAAHGHYHCAYDEVARYYEPRPVLAPAPRIYVDLSYNRHPWGWHRGWHHAAPHSYVPRHHHHHRHCRH